ncbi:DUF2911 domain-containing protein [Aquimarina algicola]|uniref:DUF2911 domain-containing protein n=1 Tax=Aquimarina algicola TaxID=2589995 RepID=A0A504J4G5_9FLAO|nr:DUF2911 domain-containing protein [Aquimarina algicola]TPN83475.1 DUF2911 domain-containing protein [Aquimarina algicola]
MKTNSITLYIFLITATVFGQLKTPSLSVTGSLDQTVGLTKIKVDYSRPNVKGRKVFAKDGLLPYGEIWRVGANAATKITFSDDISIMGNALKKGEYTILVVPQADSWSLHWYTYESTNWNTYVPKTPLLTLQLPVEKKQKLLETMEIRITDITFDQATIAIEWEKVRISIPIEVKTKEKTLASIKNTMNGPSTSEYFRAALYLHESKIDIPKALEYIQKVTASDKALFFQVTREALILKDLRQYQKAVTVAKRGLDLSKKAKNKDFIKLNTDLIKELDK